MHRSIAKPFAFLFVCLFLFAGAHLFAQGVTTAALSGTVTDKDGKTLPGANVVAVHVPSGTSYGISTRPDGRYNLQNVRVGGPYTVTVSYVGFQTEKRENLQLELGQNMRLDFEMAEEAVKVGEIEITADRNAVISSARTGAAQNVSSRQIEAFPTISRSFQDFTKFSPQFNGATYSAAGRNNRFNNVQIDGTQYNDLFGLGSSGMPGGQAGANPIALDAIQEFQVNIAPYDIKLGGFTGGGINAITKSGTNDFTGSAYYFTRSENFTGVSPDTLKTKLGQFSSYQAGFSLGGPIMKDQLFFFASGELTKRDESVDNIALTQFGGDAAGLADRMRSILKTKYGYDPGDYRSVTRERPSAKIFARLDWNLSTDHQLTFRHNYVDGSDQVIFPTKTGLEFPDRAYKFETNTNASVLQLNSRFGNTMSNELIVGYTAIRDVRKGENPSPFPSVQVKESGLTLQAGGEQFSQANALDQDIFEFTDNFSYFMGDHVFTLGTHNEFYSVRNLFIRDFYGAYVFNSMDDFENGKASQFDYSYSNTADPNQAAEFTSATFGFYGQDEWSGIDNLKLTLGLRVDIPTFPTAPNANQKVADFAAANGLNIATDKVPDGNMLFSPRFGFNWDVHGDRSTQVRGGAGVFSGRIPYVWISNGYSNTGLEFSRIRVTGANVPAFNPDPFHQPKAGDLTGVSPFTSEIDLADPDFKMPQVMRMNAAVDHQLPLGFIGTLEGVYSKAVNDLVYANYNLTSNGTSAYDGRPKFKKITADFTDVMALKNTSEGSQYSITAQLQRMTGHLYTNIGYSYGSAKDVNSVVSSQAYSQWQYNPVTGDPNAPELTRSIFEIQNRFFAAVSYALDFELGTNWKATFSLFYNGQSGRPFSYIYNGDVNGDGSRNNDMVYVPKDRDDILLGTVSGGAYVPAAASMYDAFNAYINADEYLSAHRGTIAKRNDGNEPWRDDLDFRLGLRPEFMGQKLEITLDIINVLNLMNNEWGWVQQVNNQTDALLDLKATDPASGKPVFSFNEKKTTAWQNDNIASRWQMQLGFRYSF